ncbi:TorF family putative porin [Sphingosinicella sp. BN140058]|uniref:TorF family putative porin n=1 Tax=Sphingosinicella sp. BN140058 TaxID=1892855 RepID=UPI0013ECEA9A|nr:TorF family putative porin [Sphingosinicella sp. BN140058]
MRNPVRLRVAACAALASLSPAHAIAAESGSGITISGDATLVSDYRFRGLSLSGNDPALQGGITIAHENGFYAGVWGSTIADSALMGDIELDLIGGWTGELATGTTADLSVTYYHYPRGRASAGNSDYAEAVAKLDRTLGPVETSAGIAYSWEQAAISGDNLYLFGDASADLPGTPLTLNAHVGRSSGSLAFEDHYVDWSAGIETSLGPVTAGVTYVDSDLAQDLGGGSAIVLSLGIGF